MSRSGYVLVGGGSSRMGRDKALVTIEGVPLARRAAETVAAAAGSVALVGDPERYKHLGYPVLADTKPGEGPVGGILTALRHTQADWNLVLACDMPSVTAELLDRLLRAAENSSGKALVAAGPDGRVEPLCAAWHRDAVCEVDAALARGVHKTADVLATLAATVWQVADAHYFVNLNTPEDLVPRWR